MSALNRDSARRIAAVLKRMLSSEHSGEVYNCVRALKNILTTEGLTLHDLATVIENYGEFNEPEIERWKYTDTQIEAAFTKGEAKGKAQSNGAGNFSGQFVDGFGEPRWTEIAKFCRESPGFNGLKPNEQNVVDEMPARLARWGAPLRGSGGFLLSVFWKLGGSFK